MYSFSKVRNANGFLEFRNPHFKRGNVNELAKIKRKYVGNAKKNSQAGSSKREESKEESAVGSGDERVALLSNQVQKLLETNRSLLKIIEQMKKEKEEQDNNFTSIMRLLAKRDITTETLMQHKKHDLIEIPIVPDNVSDLIDIQKNKQNVSFIERFRAFEKDNLIEAKSKISCSESFVESKAGESGVFKNIFGMVNRLENEKYSLLDAYEIQTMRKESSFRFDTVEKTNDDDKMEIEIERSRKCSIDFSEN